ncbi:hypothetical protein [Nocardioides plantarum]|uniref:Uncharacterized protein n=1 Tax=Nocardioides plantarum TaxID=29299 RepID=A0ABV5KFA3_9ACTN|nr:hypothetical protein [Nocardioides plantarum]
MKIRSMKPTRKNAAAGAAATVSAFAIVALTASAGYAAYSPHAGDLCQAAENIQFYGNDFSTPSYVVQTNEFIRMDSTGDSLVNWTDGHGDGHATRVFKYRHGEDSTGQLRVKNCH